MTHSVEAPTPRARHRPARSAGQPRPFLIVSNRLPVTVRVDADTVRLVPSSGGLATGLRGIHRASSRPWIGWPGIPREGHAPVQTWRRENAP